MRHLTAQCKRQSCKVFATTSDDRRLPLAALFILGIAVFYFPGSVHAWAANIDSVRLDSHTIATYNQTPLWIRLRSHQELKEQALDAFLQENFDQAMVMWQVLTRAGDIDAMYAIGIMYDNGLGVGRDMVEAATWYRSAAADGHSGAQFNLGMAYLHGHGVPRNLAQSVYWWRQAANQGHADAQFNLGVAYTHGSGVRRNLAKAVRWWRLAATQGDQIAQFNMGVVYANGKGVKLDINEAIKWLRLSANQGYKQAQQALSALNQLYLHAQRDEEPAFR